jgi:hypothetical protein
METLLNEIYQKYNYPSIQKFKQILKTEGVAVKPKEVEQFISKQTAVQVHKPTANFKQKQKFIVSLRPFEMIQLDLLDYQKFSKQNRGYKFILIAVDIFTRVAFAEPIKDKTPLSVLTAFKKFEVTPNAVYHDSGHEFKGVFLKYLNDNQIVDLKANIGDHNSLGIIDRFSRTLKTMIAKYMTAQNTAIYYDKVNDLIQAYNNTPHSALGDIAPYSVMNSIEYYRQVQMINMEKLKFNQSINKTLSHNMKVGDTVRIKLKKKLFQKGYEVNYSPQTYRIASIENDVAVLDNNTRHKIINLLVVNPNSANQVRNTQLAEVSRANTIKRRLRKEGIYNEEEETQKEYDEEFPY